MIKLLKDLAPFFAFAAIASLVGCSTTQQVHLKGTAKMPVEVEEATLAKSTKVHVKVDGNHAKMILPEGLVIKR